MLWPLELPFKITCVLFAALILLAVAMVPNMKWKRGRVFRLSLAIAALLFIPSCSGIMAVLDSQRFGVFQHATFDDVNDPRVESWLPSAATDIRLQKRMGGFKAKYSITEADLKKFMGRIWQKYGQYSTMSRAQIQTQLDSGRLIDTPPPCVDDDPTDWPPLTNPAVYMSPQAANGAGFTIWYSIEDGVVYQEAAYW